MCLPDFEKFVTLSQSVGLIGYRTWLNPIKNSLILKSEHRNYEWSNPDGPHEVLDSDSGLYAYNNYNNYNNYNYNYNNYYYNNYNNYNNYNYNNYYYYYNNYNNYNNYNYNIGGVIKQYGKVAIHSSGQRSEYATIKTLFSISEADAQGPEKFLDWIKIFNRRVGDIADKYKCDVISWQDFKGLQKKEKE